MTAPFQRVDGGAGTDRSELDGDNEPSARVDFIVPASKPTPPLATSTIAPAPMVAINSS
jgi:hypothetical protein